MEFDLGRLLTEESKRMMNCLHEGIFIADKMGNIVFASYWRRELLRQSVGSHASVR